jgi:hypothetical protein
MKTQVVLVAFQVFSDDPEEAQNIIAERLDREIFLGNNDSTDFLQGTYDPLNTYAVLPVAQALRDSL